MCDGAVQCKTSASVVVLSVWHKKRPSACRGAQHHTCATNTTTQHHTAQQQLQHQQTTTARTTTTATTSSLFPPPPLPCSPSRVKQADVEERSADGVAEGRHRKCERTTHVKGARRTCTCRNTRAQHHTRATAQHRSPQTMSRVSSNATRCQGLAPMRLDVKG